VTVTHPSGVLLGEGFCQRNALIGRRSKLALRDAFVTALQKRRQTGCYIARVLIAALQLRC
jgi:hypothetical protein